MIHLRCLKDFRPLKTLPFCYLCGQYFNEHDDTDEDHVPPRTVFRKSDRDPPLKLKVHLACHGKYCQTDRQTGQLLAIKTGASLPKSRRDVALNLVHYPELQAVAVDNLDVDSAVWRWVKGFHAALYRAPLFEGGKYIQTPFPKALKTPNGVHIEPLLQQFYLTVKTIKTNRIRGNIDRICSNNGKLLYEAVWCRFDNSEKWFAMFAIDIYGWKDLGSSTPELPSRCCAGLYAPKDGLLPQGAATDKESRILIPNFDKLDVFSP